MVAVVVTLSLFAVTLFYWRHQNSEFDLAREHVFSVEADQTAATIGRRIVDFELVLRGVKGLYESTGGLTRAEFAHYYDALQLTQARAGLQALGVALLIPESRRESHVQSMRNRENPDYQIKPGGLREQYAPIVLIEPFAGSNLRALGFDLLTNPRANDALMRARDTGAMAMTDSLTLVQDLSNRLPSVSMYLPIFAPGTNPVSEHERRAAFVGWAHAPFRIAELMAGLTASLPADIAISIFEGDTVSPATWLYGEDPSARASTGDIVPLQVTRPLEVGGRRWTLLLRSTPEFEQRFIGHANSSRTLIVGILISLLFGSVAWLLATSRARALALARTITQDLEEAKLSQEATLNAMPDVLFELDLNGTYLSYHTSIVGHLAAPPDKILNRRIADVLSPEATAICMAAIHEANANGMSVGKQIQISFGDAIRWYELSVARKNDPKLELPRFVMISRDITDRKLIEEQLALHAQVFESSRDGIVISDAQNRIVSVNKAFSEIFGFTREEVLGKNPSVMKSSQHERDFYQRMWAQILNEGRWQGELYNRRKSGEIFPVGLSITVVRDSAGRVLHFIGILTDLTESKSAQAHIEYLSNYDTLTRLPNKDLMQSRAGDALVQASRSRSNVALLAIDLDRFQNINDSLGLPVGDEVLRILADRLVGVLHHEQSICRPGGDEFMVLLPGTNGDAAAAMTEKILAVIREPVSLANGEELRITASIGIAVSPFDGTDFDRLSQSADAALKAAKQTGRGTYKFFAEYMREDAFEILFVENQLRDALKNRQLVLQYQPQIDATRGIITGAEALIRWNHPDRGLMLPARFIPIAEGSGQILEIGEWVIDAAVRQVVAWRNAGLAAVPVAVNLSARQFHQKGLCELIGEILARHDLPAAMLELELTESVAMEDSSFTVDQISKLHAMGLRLSIDDFGTGYSSLTYLKRYQIDKVKIDQSFVHELGRSANDGAIVRAIIGMAHDLGFKTIAEGVETREQLELLRAEQCDEIQGFLFSEAVPPEVFAELLRRGVPYQASVF